MVTDIIPSICASLSKPKRNPFNYCSLHLVFLVLVSCKGSLIATGRYIIANDHIVKAATSGISLLVTNKLDRDEKRMQL